jgi:tetratricopeptide (TPR) repeat protein
MQERTKKKIMRKIKKNETRKNLFIFILIILFSSCVSKTKIELTPQQLIEFQNNFEAADALYKAGSYACLKESYAIYKDLLSIPHDQKIIKTKLLKTAILLTIRQKELGIHDSTYFNEASDMVQNNPFLTDFLTYLDLADSIRLKSKGMRGDIIDIRRRADEIRERLMENIEKWGQELEEKSEAEEFYAYLHMAKNCQLAYFIKGMKVTRKEVDLTHLQRIFPHSPLIVYMLSLCPKEDYERLKELLAKEPRFYEIYYFLGKQAFQQLRLVTAEKNFLKCFEYIPESLPTVISLAELYFTFEELEKSLSFYEKALSMIPESREALLGKVSCLSYLERHEEAVEVCREILRLGGYYLGDTHYWLAWNLNELERLDEAWKTVEKSKTYLVGYSQVFSLAGVIAYKRKEKKIAEKNFQEALRLDPSNCEAAYYLGKIYAEYQEWVKSGEYYEMAALCQYGKELGLERNLAEIEDSDFSEERKQKLIAKKKIQLKKTILI